MRKDLWQWLIKRANLPGLAAVVTLVLASPARADSDVILLDLEGALGVATAEFIIGGIDSANERNADLVIIRMDTPGGLVEPMRDIVQAILGSDVPVATYVSPGGGEPHSCNGAYNAPWRCNTRVDARR
jgi:membrane-bound serine protease (ClpP class)